VLANNERHGLQLSLDHTRGVLDPVSFAGAIDWVTRRGNATRAALRLPTDDDLARRKQARHGLTRPELATIQAHVKLHVFKDLIAADPRAVPGFDDAVQAYFPARIRAAYGDDVQKHMLHTSIGMTVVMNDCIGDAGAALFPLLLSLTGARPERVLAAWVRAWEVADGATLKAALLGPDVPVEAGYRAWVAATASMATLCALWCAAGEPGEAHEDRAAITEALALLPTLKGTEIEARLAARAEPHSSRGVPASLAMRVAALGKVTLAREAVLARRAGESLSDALVRTYAVGDASRLLHAIRALEARPASGGADGIAMGILRTRFVRLLRSLVAAVPIAPDVLALGLDRVTTRLNREDLRDLQSLMDGLLGESPDVAALLVAEERVRGWITAYEARVRGA
jgi:glutamate dehydrogenase